MRRTKKGSKGASHQVGYLFKMIRPVQWSPLLYLESKVRHLNQSVTFPSNRNIKKLLLCFVLYFITSVATHGYLAENNSTPNTLDVIETNVDFQVKADIIKHKSYEVHYSGSTCGLAPFTVYATTSSFQNPAHFQ